MVRIEGGARTDVAVRVRVVPAWLGEGEKTAEKQRTQRGDSSLFSLLYTTDLNYSCSPEITPRHPTESGSGDVPRATHKYPEALPA